MKNKNLVYVILGIAGMAMIVVFIIGIKIGLKNIEGSPLASLAPLIALITPEEAKIEEIIIPPVTQEEIIKEKETEEVIITTHMINIKTNKGNIKIELFGEDTPITVDNFVSLTEKGFYDGVIFHRVINGFMIQGGCPLGTGRGGPGWMIPCEFYGYNKNSRGTIAMANAGPNTGGSQFFINLVDNNFLDNKHTVFGRVVEGMDVVDVIGGVETTGPPHDRPIEYVVIKNIEIYVAK